MIKFFKIAIAVAFFLLAVCTQSEALTCSSPTCKEKFIQATTVFKGKAISSHKTSDIMQAEYQKSLPSERKEWDGLPNTYTDFEVLTPYKWVPAKTVRVFYGAEREEDKGKSEVPEIAGYWAPPPFKAGDETVIWAESKMGFYITSLGSCSGCGDDSTNLDTLMSSYDALEALIKNSPSTVEFYTKKAALYEEYGDYANAVLTYERLFKAVEAAAREERLMVNYGRNLYFFGQHEKAIQALRNLTSEEGKSYIQLSLLKLDRLRELDGQAVNFSHQTLQEISLSKATLPSSNFSGVNLEKIKLEDVKLDKSDFSGAQLNNVKFDKAKISHSNFKKAGFYAQMLSSNFDASDFSDANITIFGWGDANNQKDSSGNSFRNANFSNATLEFMGLSDSDFSGANFTNAKISSLRNAKVDGANFTGATFYFGRYPGYIQGLNLSGQKLENASFFSNDAQGASFKGANLRNANFGAALLTKADFTNADLRGANFSGSSDQYHTDVSGADFTNANLEGTRWVGVTYDCTTKFPASFSPIKMLMVNSQSSSCTETTEISKPDYSAEKQLTPPLHYRLLEGRDVIKFVKADLRNANFEGMTIGMLVEVNLTGANLRFTKGSPVVGMVTLDGADLSYSHLGKGYMSYPEKSKAKGAKLYCADMTEIGLYNNVDYSDADWTAAIFRSGRGGWPKELSINPIKNKVLYSNMPEIIGTYGAADYSNLDLSKCDLMKINFGSTNLSGVKFKGSYLWMTDFSKANLTGADFNGARLTINTVFPEDFDLKKFKFIPVALQAGSQGNPEPVQTHWPGVTEIPDIQIPDFPNEDLSKIDLQRSWLPKAKLSKANLSFSDFSHSNLGKADLSNANARGAVFKDTNLNGATLAGADLDGADLRAARLAGANLKNTNLKNALYDDLTEWPTDFDPKSVGAYKVVLPKPNEGYPYP